MKYRMIGNFQVSEIGLGMLGLSYKGRPDEDEAIKLIHEAWEIGINFVDTADCYCLSSAREHGFGERLLKKALESWSGDKSQIIVATKGGKIVDEDGLFVVDGSPDSLKKKCDESLKALGLDAIALYQLHAPDPKVPLEDSVGALVELLEAGKIQSIGVCNVDINQLGQAMTVAPLVSVQNSFSPLDRSSADIVEFCTIYSLAFIAHSPFGGMERAKKLGENAPRFQALADVHSISVYQVAIAWELHFSPLLVPIPSFRTISSLHDTVLGANFDLTGEEMAYLNEID